ncbi:MAG: carboxypeptidase regulatory-like domain-containing protein [Planctomycetota bacterium]
MKKLILPLGLILAGIAAWILLQKEPTPEQPLAGLAQPDSGPSAAAAPAAAAAIRVEPKEAAFTNRRLKTGAGHHQLRGLVVDEGGRPVPGAWVASYSVPVPLLDFEFEVTEIFDHLFAFSLEPLASTSADENGRFALDGLLGRTVYLTARTTQRLTPRRQRVLPALLDSDQDVVVRTVAAADLRGRVVDPQGNPVAGSEVLVAPGIKYLLAAFRNRTFFVDRTYTDAKGEFYLNAVPAGMPLTAAAFPTSVESGVAEFGPLKARATGRVLTRLSETGALAGSVIDPDKEPVAKATVVAVPLDLRRGIPFLRDPGGWTATANSRGRFRFPKLPRGPFLLLAQGREGRSGPVSAQVADEDSTVAPIEIDTRTRVEGRVVRADGKPVVNALVRLQSIPSGSKERNGRDGRDPQDMPGGLLFQGIQEILPELLPDETFTYTDSRGGFKLPAWRKARLRITRPGYTDADFKLSSLKKDKEPVLVVFQPGSIEGIVVDAGARKPVGFYTLQADRKDSKFLKERIAGAAGLDDSEQILLPSPTWHARLAVSRLVDSPDGKFRIEEVPAGKWRLKVKSPGYADVDSDELEVLDGKTTQGVVISLDHGATVAGRVVAYGTHDPVVDAVVSVGRGEGAGWEALLEGLADQSALGITDAQGFFLINGVSAGGDHISVIADGWATASEEIPPVEEYEERTNVQIELHVGGTVTGRVTDRHGVPLAGRMVGGMSVQARDFNQTTTDENGVYKIEHMRPGSYFMLVAALDDDSLFTLDMASILLGARLKTVYVYDGRTVVLDIVDMSAGGCRLAGRVERQGAAVPFARLSAAAAESSGLFDIRISTARADQKGEFVFKSLAPGDYRFNLDTREGNASIDVVVPDAADDFQVLEIPAGSIHGRVVSELTGEPAAKATLHLVREDSPPPRGFGLFGGGIRNQYTSSDEKGEYVFDAVAPGRYHVDVSMNRFGRPGDKGSIPLGKARTESFELGFNEVRTLDPVGLPVAGRIRVTLLDESGGTPAGGLRLRAVLLGEDGKETKTSQGGWTNTGEGALDSLAAGDYRVTADGQGFIQASAGPVTVQEGRTAEVTLTLVRGVLLRVRILDGQDQPIPGAKIQVLDDHGNPARRNDSGGFSFARFFGGSGDGSFPAGTFAPGTYTVRATWQDQTRETHVRLSHGEDALAEIRF